jgi:hypothetical protein
MLPRLHDGAVASGARIARRSAVSVDFNVHYAKIGKFGFMR